MPSTIDPPAGLDSTSESARALVADRLEPGTTALIRSHGTAAAAVNSWRGRARWDSSETSQRWLLAVPDVGPACEVVLADRLFHDLSAQERAGLGNWIRGCQDRDGTWRRLDGEPDLSLTALGWWARAQLGDDPASESMVRAVRAVHAMGGAQRANFSVRLWLAIGGQIPWSFLPAIPSELFLLPQSVVGSPTRFSPWARGILTPYLVIARGSARLQLTDARSLLLKRADGSIVSPRLTRPGLAGDLLQAFDRGVRISRKLPRGPFARWAMTRTQTWLDQTQQEHGGWFSVRPTLLSLLALRVLGASSDDPRVLRGLAYLRRGRGLARIPGGSAAGSCALAQGVGGVPLAMAASIIRCSPQISDIAWLLGRELNAPGPWQARTDARAGGWPTEPGARKHPDLAATCAALEALSTVGHASTHAPEAWSATRRATHLIIAMQEPQGNFPRFERGESNVLMRHFPWTDAQLLASGHGSDEVLIRLTSKALTHLGRTGFRMDDDRIARGVRWLDRSVRDATSVHDMQSLCVVAQAVAAVCPTAHPLRAKIERRVRVRQREDGSFGNLASTAMGLRALLALSAPCVQAARAVHSLISTVEHATDLDALGSCASDGLGLSPKLYNPSAGACETALALREFHERTSKR